jgi:iron complex outermembrane receptor protein
MTARRRFTTGTISLLALVLNAPANAQQPDSVTPDSVPLYRLQGITVTVSRSRESVNRLPYAVGLLGAAEVQALRATISLDESLTEIPGVFVANRYNLALGDRISIRGFGARSQFGVRGVRIIQDGIPLTLADGQSQLNNLDLAAAGRIEVIRGPASALYGNASGGVISVQTESSPAVPIKPELWALGGDYGNGRYYQKYDLKAGGRAGDFDYLGHIGLFRSDGYRLHSAAKSSLINARLRWVLNERSDLTAVINYANAPQAQSPSTLADSIARVRPDTARDLALSLEQCPPDPGFGGCQDLGEESGQGQVGVTYRRRLSEAHLISVMGYGLFRTLENRIPFTLIELDRWAGGARVEYRFAPPGSRFSGLTAGLDLDQQSDGRVERPRDDEGLGPVALDQDERVTGLGLFALGGWLFTPTLELSISARYDRVRFEVDDRLVTAEDPDDSGSRTMDQLSPMVGLRWTPAPWLNAYANVGRSFQTPTTTELTDSLGGFNETLQPERATNYELGFKGTVGDRLSYSLAVFHADIEDLIIGSESPITERVFFRNAASSVHNGVEAGFTALLISGLTLTGSYTYSDFTFEDFRSAAGDFSGNRLPGIPIHRLYGRVNYLKSSGFTSYIQATGVDSYFVDNANLEENDGYVVFDVRFGYAVRTARLQILPILGLNNLFDVRYSSSVVINAVGGRYYEPAPGRNFYLGLRVSSR